MYLDYGVSPATMNLNLTGYERLRISFAGLSNPLNDLVIAVQQGSGQVGECALGVPSSQYLSDPLALTVDFPLSAFTVGTNWSDIRVIEIIFEGGNLAITQFVAIPNGSTEPAANFTCGA
jgi:hypothetical protein